MRWFWPFVAVQVIDAATTVVGLHLGLAEGNPIVAAALGLWRPIPGLLIAKSAAILIAAAIWRRGHKRIYKDGTIIFCCAVLWNLLKIGGRLET
jgi:hypothetical protein